MGKGWRVPRWRSCPENELGIHVGHEMPGGEEYGDVAARVHDDVLLASGEPPAFEQRQHLAAPLVDVDDAAAIGDASIVQCPLDLLLSQFSECPCRCFGPLLPELALGFLERVPKRSHECSGLACREAVSDAKCLQVCVQEFCQDSCATAHSAADAGHDVCQGQDSWRAAKSGTGFDVRVLAERWECHLCEAEALHHGPVGLDAGQRAEPLLHLRRHVRLAPLCTGLSWLVIASTIASTSPAAAGSSPAGSATAVIVSYVGCPSPPRWWLRPQIFDTAVHGVDEPTETLSPFSASGRPPNTTCPDTWPWEQKTCRLCTAPLETGLLLQSSITLRSRTNEKTR